MEIDWGGTFNYTSCEYPMANWQGHETHPTGHKTSEVDWGGHDPNGPDNPPPMYIINLDDLLGRTFLLPMDENGERKRATIHENVKDLCQQQVSREDQLRFKLKIDGDQPDDLIIYNQLMEYLEDKTDTGPLEDGLHRLKCTKDHKGPYTSSEVDWGGHDPYPNHVNESLLSEVDWGAHNPDADDPEQLTGESIQSFLTFVVQLQWFSSSGETCHPCTSHYLVQACGGIILISRPTFMDIYPYFQDNTSFKFPSSTHTHTHTYTHKLYIYLYIIMHVSTRTCYIHHKRGVTEF